jgi:tryptophan-rich sensory protein
MMKKLLLLLACIAVPLCLGAWAGIVTSSNIATWYAHLHQPSFNPPNWLFAPVWTTLYILMGVSFYLVLQAAPTLAKSKAVQIAIFQLALNTLWSFLFFYFHLIGIALLEILLMWLSILWMIRAYWPIHRFAAILQIPYLAWVSFASILNAAYFLLN